LDELGATAEQLGLKPMDWISRSIHSSVVNSRLP
jgi:hypothetical protein